MIDPLETEKRMDFSWHNSEQKSSKALEWGACRECFHALERIHKNAYPSPRPGVRWGNFIYPGINPIFYANVCAACADGPFLPIRRNDLHLRGTG
jgi:hypothetical protein